MSALISNSLFKKIFKVLIVILTLYIFLLSIKLLGHSFKLLGKGFAETLIQMTSNPFAGLLIGIVATSLIQSSSTTTSIVVGLVAGGALNLAGAVPIIMGANIGTTITNTLVSFGHITNRIEFKRAFSSSVVHDFFNILAVIVLFPLELYYNVITRVAVQMEGLFSGAGGYKAFNPLNAIIDPVIGVFDNLFSYLPYTHIMLMVFSIILMFFALTNLIKTMRSLVLTQLEVIINDYLFKNALTGLLFGILMTILVQSSSITTSMIIPLAGAGVVTIRQLFPYTLGANIGTTVTALLAAMTTQNDIAVTVAFSHLVFNIFGIVMLYPFREIPIRLAEWVGEIASVSSKNLTLFIIVYILLHFIPVIFIIF